MEDKNLNFYITKAVRSDVDELAELYKSFYGGPAGWSVDYPNRDTIDFDLKRDSLFVMKNVSGEIVAAATIDDDKDAEELDIWTVSPARILSRICVRRNMQNRGLARRMLSYITGYMKDSGFKGARLLIHEGNDIAIRSYTRAGFHILGERLLDGINYICMEQEIQ